MANKKGVMNTPVLDDGNETKTKDKQRLLHIYKEKLQRNEKLPRLSPMMRNASFAERAKWLTSVIIEESRDDSKYSLSRSPVHPFSKEPIKLPVMHTVKTARNRWKGVALSVSRELEEIQAKVEASKRAQIHFKTIIGSSLITRILSYSSLRERMELACSNTVLSSVETKRRTIAQALNENAQIVFSILSFLLPRQRAKYALVCRKWRNLQHPVFCASELNSYRSVVHQLNLLPPALDLVFLVDKRSPETSAFHCSQTIKHAVERIEHEIPGIEIRVGVIVFNKYPEPLEETYWVKGGFPPSAHIKAKACMRKRTSDHIQAQDVTQEVEVVEGDTCKSDVSSEHSGQPDLGNFIKQPSFLTDNCNEEERAEIEGSWREVLGKWLKDPLKRSEKNASFVVKRFGFVDYERPGNNKMRKKKIKQQIVLLSSQREVTKSMLTYQTSFNEFGFASSPPPAEALGIPERLNSTSSRFSRKGPRLESDEYDEDEDNLNKMKIRSGESIPMVKLRSRPSSRQSRGSTPPSRGFEESSEGYLKHLAKRIPHKRKENSIGKWNMVEYKKVAAYAEEFDRWQAEQRAKHEIVELTRLAKAAKEREKQEKKLYQKLLRQQRQSLKGFELLIEKVAKLLDENYDNNLSKGAATIEEEEEEEEKDMNGSALGAALALLLGNENIGERCRREVGPALHFRPHATKLCFLVSSSSPISLELHAKPPFQRGDPCGFDPIKSLHEIADRGIRICPIVSRSIQNWDSALGFMQGVAKITKSSNPGEDKITGGVAYIAPSELTAPYILQEVIYSVSQEMLDRDRMKNEVLIKLKEIDDQGKVCSGDDTKKNGGDEFAEQYSFDTSSTVSSSSQNNLSTLVLESTVSHHSAVIVMKNPFTEKVARALKLMQQQGQSLHWEQRYHEGRLPLFVSKKRLKQFSLASHMKKFVPAPPSPCELANIYHSVHSAIEAKVQLAEIEAEKIVRAQTDEVLAEVRNYVKEANIGWKSLRWCDRVKVCTEARIRIQSYTREMRVAIANRKVERRAKTMSNDRRHNTKFQILLKELCEGNKEAFAIFLQAKVRAFLIRQRTLRRNAKHFGDDVSALSTPSYESFSSFHLDELDDDCTPKLISDNQYAEIAFMSTDTHVFTLQDALNLLREDN